MNQLRIVTSSNETVICFISLLMIVMERSSSHPPGQSKGESLHYHLTKASVCGERVLRRVQVRQCRNDSRTTH